MTTPLRVGEPWTAETEQKIGKWSDITAGIFSTGLMLVLWYLGGLTTLMSLRAMGFNLDGLGALEWIIPVGFSSIETVYSFTKSRLPSYAKAVFFFVAVLDLLSTFFGTAQWAASRELPLASGINIPKDGAGLFIPVAIAAIILTFGPEQVLIRLIRYIISIARSK